MNPIPLKRNLQQIFGEAMFRTIDGLERDVKQVAESERDEQDMDLGEDGSPTKPLNAGRSPSRVSSVDGASSTAPSTPSASLDDLEREKEQLLKRLDAAAEETDATETEETMDESESATDVETDANAPFTPTYTRSKSVLLNMGTPIGVNSTVELPDAERFRQNITDHIPYENLPNATGMFSKMMTVISKVRVSIKESK